MPAPSPVLVSQPAGAAVVQVHQDGEGLLDDIVQQIVGFYVTPSFSSPVAVT
jgi:DNA-binding transcriptional MocR family regulator